MEENKIKAKNKIGTIESKKFIIEFFGKKKMEMQEKDWELRRKYKNIKGQTCRDFVYIGKAKWFGINACVVVDQEKKEMVVLENVNHSFFARQAIAWILFDYALFSLQLPKQPVRFIIAFKLKKHFEQSNLNVKSLLDECLEKTDTKLAYIKEDNEIFFYEINSEPIDHICNKLQKDRFDINEKLSDLILKKHLELKPLILNVEYVGYSNEAIKELSYQQGMDQTLDILGRGNQLKKYEIGLIKRLIEKIPASERSVFSKIVLDMDFEEKKLIEKIFLSINKEKDNYMVQYFCKN